VYFRALLVGYFEGLDGDRAIAWRIADSLSLRKFRGYGLDETTPDHSTISRTRRLYWLSTHQAVFKWVLKRLAETGLVRGETVSVDATTLEANAAVRSIVRRIASAGAGYLDLTGNIYLSSDRPALLLRDRGADRDPWRGPGRPRGTLKEVDGLRLAAVSQVAVDLLTGPRGNPSEAAALLGWMAHNEPAWRG
jgi:hypothetical protein